MKNKKMIGIIIIVLVILIIILPNLMKSGEDKAWDYSKEYVLDRLKSPSTAEFCSKEEAEIIRADSSTEAYGIMAYVDSENGFGATMRARFDIIVAVTDDGYEVLHFEVFEAID